MPDRELISLSTTDLNDLLVCPECMGTGVVDTGGSYPWGEWINIVCELCRGVGKTTVNEATKAGWKVT